MLHFINVATATLAAVLLTAISSSPKAWAATVFTGSSFTGSSHGAFGTPVIDTLIDANATFSIEKPNAQSESFILGEPGNGSMPNKLTFVGTTFSTMPEQVFSVGSLSYLNGQTFSGTNVSSVPLGVSLNFLQPGPTQQQFQYSFAFNLTPNSDQSSSADNLTLSENPAPQTFEFEQAKYNLKILGFSVDNGVTFTRDFQVPEDQIANGVLLAQIKLASLSSSPIEPEKPQDIPEPALLQALLLVGATTVVLRKRTRIASA
jgi:hypothetical protein